MKKEHTEAWKQKSKRPTATADERDPREEKAESIRRGYTARSTAREGARARRGRRRCDEG